MRVRVVPALALGSALLLSVSGLGQECGSAHDSIEYGTCGAPPSKTNYGREFDDLTITSSDGQVSVTAIPALAGGIASLKFRGQELIATGGHGASFQYAVHPYYPSRGLPASECDNPTEAGSQDDFDAATVGFPGLSRSSSGIINYWKGVTGIGLPQIATQVNMAYFVPENQVSAYSGHCDNYSAGRLGFVKDRSSFFILNKWITMGKTIHGKSYPHVVQFDSSVKVPRMVEKMDITLIAYMTRRMTKEIFYNPVDGTVYRKRKGEAYKNSRFNNTTAGPVARIYTDQSERIAIGVLVPTQKKDAKESEVPKSYTATSEDFGNVNASGEAYFTFRTIASQHHYANLRTADSVDAHSTFVLGTLDEIKAISVEYCKEQGACR